MNMLEAALKYAEMGFAVFPVRRDKKPYTPNGFKDAKKDKRAIRFWWNKWKDANIGIATGSVSGGIVVIDVDVDKDKGIYGDESLKEWENEHGELPNTWRVVTGRGGYHYYYKTNQKIKSAASIYPGIDVRGEGGYIIAPPSIHENGRYYNWEVNQSPEDIKIHIADDKVMEFLKISKNSEGKSKFVLPEVIQKGKRNDTLYRYGCSLQAKGYEDDEIREKLQEANMRCTEALTDSEINTICSSVFQLEKGEKVRHITINDPEWHKPDIHLTEQGIPLRSSHNFEEAVRYDERLFKKLRKNELAYAPYVFGELPWDESNKVREWTNEDDAHLIAFIENEYHIYNKEKLMNAISTTADYNSYNPVKDMLEQRHLQWDEQPHIENLLSDYLGVTKDEYSVEVMKLFMLGAVTRAYHPGCKFDYVPIIYGTQGCGKSTFCRLLAVDDEWFDDNFNTIEGDKAAEKLRGLWIAEMAELLATKKAKEIESIKSFITSRRDRYRPPYGRRTENRDRVCVFIGTTNSEHFLTDRTGNRRFLPLIADGTKAKKSLMIPENHKQAIIDINNAWGEAMELYSQANGEPVLMLPEHLQNKALEMQNRFLEDNPTVGKIQEYLDNCTSERVCVLEIWEKAMGMSGEPSRFETNNIHTIMQTEITGWEKDPKRQRCGEYGRQTCYKRITGDFIDAGNIKSPFEIKDL